MDAATDDNWACPECTLLNKLLAEACEACGATSPLVLAALAAQSESTERERKDSEESNSSSRPSRGSSMDEDYKKAVDLDPWSQAEDEWARVEATQATKTTKPRK
ncbi:hypothetical protein H310_05680 [Aphanomyces invadans]|uniref:RanBP2-type domain-containing protein n=1 Tax=Aphanomyces invadans TaxID=157072 RepID=A0A024U8Y2_9STRA|nr:hypothetical protein H310_05680 [Aphanomyces invadans]ETW02068.1 hypothetical protein H310_05680 [Aphanomyces invadans]|eukprot:XP_008868673.1 hypothetical protein H310_05680 [Aphanomyces invadans]